MNKLQTSENEENESGPNDDDAFEIIQEDKDNPPEEFMELSEGEDEN